MSRLVPGALLFFGCHANSLRDSWPFVYFMSSADTRNHGLSVLPANFDRAVSLLAVRKLVTENWNNDTDEYLRPNGVGS